METTQLKREALTLRHDALRTRHGPRTSLTFVHDDMKRARVCKTAQFISNSVYTEGRKEGGVLFNDALNILYLRLYGVGHMVKYHSDSEKKPAAATWPTLSN